MKTKKISLLLFCALFSFCLFTSCSDDDDEGKGNTTKTSKLYVSKITLDGFEQGTVSYYEFNYDENYKVTGWNAQLTAGSNVFNVSRKINYTTEENPGAVADGIKSVEEYVNGQLMFTETYPQEHANSMTFKDALGAYTTITDISYLWQYLTVAPESSHIDCNYRYESFSKDPNPQSLKVVDNDNRRDPRWIQYDYTYTYDETKKGIFTDCNLPVWLINMRFYGLGEDFPMNQNISKTCTSIQYKKTEGNSSLTEVQNVTKIFDVSYNDYGYPTTITDKETNRKYTIEYKVVTQ